MRNIWIDRLDVNLVQNRICAQLRNSTSQTFNLHLPSSLTHYLSSSSTRHLLLTNPIHHAIPHRSKPLFTMQPPLRLLLAASKHLSQNYRPFLLYFIANVLSLPTQGLAILP